MGRTLIGLVALLLAILAPAQASALISGGEGNDALADPGWPKGAEAIFNDPAASPGGKARHLAAVSGMPSAGATRNRSEAGWTVLPNST